MKYVQKEKILQILINIGYNFDGCKKRSKMRGGPSAEKRQKKSTLAKTQKKGRENQNPFQTYNKKHTKESYFRTNFVFMEKIERSLPIRCS